MPPSHPLTVCRKGNVEFSNKGEGWWEHSNFSGNEINKNVKIQRKIIPKICPWKRMPHKELLKDLHMTGSDYKLREDSAIPTHDSYL